MKWNRFATIEALAELVVGCVILAWFIGAGIAIAMIIALLFKEC